MTTADTGAPASRVLTQGVACDWRHAYRWTAEPANLPEWASGLAEGAIRPLAGSDDQWEVETPGGRATLRFAPPNAFGVLDHWVQPPGVAEVYVPFRVIATGQGRCELQMTLLRQPGMDDAAFERDSAWIARDLLALARVLEAN